MKCQNCGKHEATCHYTSNINGIITENHYCSQCAAEAGWGEGILNTDSIFNNMFGSFGGIFGAPRLPMSPWGLGFRVPALIMPYKAAETEIKNEPAASPAEKTTTLDPEMQKRREINALREQMRSAAESEDFEKAAQLRDKLREMEK